MERDPLTYTRCQENVHGYQMVLGGLASSGLDVDYYNVGEFEINGVGALRKV